jgi:hypothetical protein
LSFYVLPAFAAVLKIRAKKLSQMNTSSSSTSITTSATTNLAFLDTLSTKFAGIYFSRKDLSSDINSAYSPLLLKNEAYYQFNFLILNQFKMVTFFI